MIEITLSTGQRVLIWERSVRGMAGEPMSVLYCRTKKPKQQLALRDIIPLMNPMDQKRIKQWWRDISSANHYSAVAWTV